MKRKYPKQERAKRSIEFIADAAIQVLDSDDVENFTTNHIAERAGVSVGTIYRYFKNKREIFRYMVRREIRIGTISIRETLKSSSASSGESIAKEVIDQSLHLFDQRPRATFNIIQLMRQDSELRAEAYELFRELNKEIYERLMAVEPDRFEPMSEDSLSSSLAAYYAAIIAVMEMKNDRSLDLDTQTDLALSLLETFKRDGLQAENKEAKPK